MRQSTSAFESVGCPVGYAGVIVPQALDELGKFLVLDEDECCDFASAAGVKTMTASEQHRSD